jgi:pimeloyl-ACP methyl ester carboxylesterase
MNRITEPPATRDDIPTGKGATMHRRSFVKMTTATSFTAGTLLLNQSTEHAMANQTEATPATSGAFESGYAPVNGLELYYEIHGSGGTPLVLLHGGLFNIDLQFGALLPALSANRQVIALDFQGHGRTGDIDRPFSYEAFATDVVGLLEHLGVSEVDVFGFSVGAGTTVELAVSHPQILRKVIVSSVSFSADGVRPENAAAVAELTPDLIKGTPMYDDFMAKSPTPDRLADVLDKLSQIGPGFAGWTEDQIQAIQAPTLITVGDCDMVRLDHAIRFLQLRGGDVNGDFVGVPASQLAVLPGTTHFFGLANPGLVLEIVTPFLDAPMPEDAPATPAAG